MKLDQPTANKQTPAGDAFSRKARFKYGILASAMSVALVVLLVVANLVLYLVDQRQSLDIDLTSQQQYSRAAAAGEFLHSLTKDVTLTVIQAEDKFDPRTVEALKSYAESSPRITYRVVDITLNPRFADSFAGYQLSGSSIIFQCGDNFKILEESDLYYTTTVNNATKIAGIKIDQKFCSAIAAVTSDIKLAACFTKGHGEADTADLQSLCQDLNRDPVQVDLTVGEIDAAADTLLICEPTKDFAAAEIKKIEDWLTLGNKNLLLLIDAQVAELPELFAFAGEWGIGINGTVVIDPDHYWGGNQTYLLADYADSAITTELKSSQINTVLPLSRSFDLLFETSANYETFPILRSFDTSYAKEVAKGTNSLEKQEGDQTGAFLIGAGSTRVMSINNETVNSNVIVYGSAAMTSAYLLNYSALGNKDLLVNSITYGKTRADTVSIDTVFLKDTTLSLTAAQLQMNKIILVLIIPLGMIIIGFVVWQYRRKK